MKTRSTPDRDLRYLPWLIAASGLLLAVLLLFSLPQFRIQRFSFNRLYFQSAEEILAASECREGQHFLSAYGGSLENLLLGHYGPLEEKLKKCFPAVKSFSVTLRFPGEIHFEVNERIPIAYIRVADGVALIDREQYLIEISQKVKPALPEIEGLELVNGQIGEKITVNVPEDLERTIGVLSALVEADLDQNGLPELLPQLVEIRPSGFHKVSLRIQRPNQHELLISCSLTDYLSGHFIWLRRVLGSGSLDAAGSGTLDLSGKNQVFRPLRPAQTPSEQDTTTSEESEPGTSSEEGAEP